jgi:hypothetical protein
MGNCSIFALLVSALLVSACGRPFSLAEIQQTVRTYADPGEAMIPMEPSPSGQWTAPALTWVGEGDAPRCPDSAPAPSWEAFDAISADPAECACDCAPDQPGEIWLNNVAWGEGYMDKYACDGAHFVATGGVFKPGKVFGCMQASPTSPPGAPGYWPCFGAYVGETTRIDGTCKGQTAPAKLAPPRAVGLHARACIGDVTLPADGAWSVCIMSVGLETCPADFPEGRALRTGTKDSRSCSPCTCGKDPGIGSVAVTAFSSQGCTGATTATVTTPEPSEPYAAFAPATGNILSILVLPSWSAGTCDVAVQPEATGDVTLAANAMVCCR